MTFLPHNVDYVVKNKKSSAPKRLLFESTKNAAVLGEDDFKAQEDNSGDVSDEEENSDFVCSWCERYEENKDTPVVGILYKIIHFFIHMAEEISYHT